MARYGWARSGDVNAFFGLMLDNVAVMVLLVGLISDSKAPELQTAGDYKFTPQFVLTHMIPGTALGVLFGDLAFTWMAFRLARRTGRTDVTAMPLGLDTPSTFAVAFLVLLTALNQGRSRGMDHERAMLYAWHVGLTVLVMVGIFKVVCAPLGNAVRRWVPRAGLLGSLAAIALTLIAFLPVLFDGIAGLPLVGLPALTIILVALVAHRELPHRFPGALAAVVVGVAAYGLFALLGDALGWPLVGGQDRSVSSAGWSPPTLLPAFVGPDGWDWWGPVFGAALRKLPVILPFALATIVGGIDCTESAAAAGDEFDTRAVLLTEAVASLGAGLLGGVVQTVPYIGHPAYKKMGGRAAYTLATALFIGLAGMFGWFGYLFAWLPRAALFPILVFVGLEITAQSFKATPTKHYAALAMAFLPALAYLITVPLKLVLGPNEPPASAAVAVQTLWCLSGGFIVTSLLWAASLAALLDGKLRRAAAYLAVAGVCAFFGIIHSPLRDEQIDLPQNVLATFTESRFEAVQYQTPYHWAVAYGLSALLLVGLSFLPSHASKEGGEDAMGSGQT
jgi:AGZA family xanthine/uracil permease-like MFS transporter